MIDDDEPRPNSPEDLGWTPQALERRAPPAPHIPRIERRTTMSTKAEAKEPKDEGPRGFAPILQQVQDGDLHTELSVEMQRLVGELHTFANKYQRTAKGKITLSLGFDVSPNGSVHIIGDVKVAVPKRPRAATTFFRTPGNNLSVEHPLQTKLPLREVPASTERPREVNHETAAPKGL